MNNNKYIGKFVGTKLYKNNNELLLKFQTEEELLDFIDIIIGISLDILPEPSVSELMLYRKEKRMKNKNE